MFRFHSVIERTAFAANRAVANADAGQVEVNFELDFAAVAGAGVGLEHQKVWGVGSTTTYSSLCSEFYESDNKLRLAQYNHENLCFRQQFG